MRFVVKPSIYVYNVVLNILDLMSLCESLMIYGLTYLLIDGHISRIINIKYQINSMNICWRT